MISLRTCACFIRGEGVGSAVRFVRQQGGVTLAFFYVRVMFSHLSSHSARGDFFMIAFAVLAGTPGIAGMYAFRRKKMCTVRACQNLTTTSTSTVPTVHLPSHACRVVSSAKSEYPRCQKPLVPPGASSTRKRAITRANRNRR